MQASLNVINILSSFHVVKPSLRANILTDVIFVKEEMPSSEQMALAQKYMLPKSFFLYENKAPCRGCLGCYDDIEGTIYKS